MALVRHTARLLRSQSCVLEARILANSFTSGQGSTTGQKKEMKKAVSKPPPHEVSTTGMTYEVPEYYAHNEFSFYDFEEIMAKDRLPQPKAK